MPRGIPNNPEKRSKVTPVAPIGFNDAQDHQIGQDAPRVLKSTGPSKDALEPQYIQVVDRPVNAEKLEMLAFMDMPVTVHIHTTTDKSAEQVFEIFNNGQREVFRRGETKTVKRKFVNEMATRKVTSFMQEKRRDPEGVMHDVQVPTSALRYPFSVVSDPHVRGADWLKATLAQP